MAFQYAVIENEVSKEALSALVQQQTTQLQPADVIKDRKSVV